MKYFCGERESMNDCLNTIVGCPTHSFYGKTSTNDKKENVTGLRRKRKLEKREKEIASKKPADALSLSLNFNKSVGSAGVEKILTSHSKTYKVFLLQNEAIQFVKEKVSYCSCN